MMNLNRLLQEESVPYDMLHDAPTTTASEAFVESMQAGINRDDLQQMMASQHHMLLRFEKTNEMLQTFLSLSATRYAATVDEFQKHTLIMTDMKKDLDSIFKRIRMLKIKLGKQYPRAFAACSDVHYDMLEEEQGESSNTVKPVEVRPSRKKKSKQRPYSTPVEVRIQPSNDSSQEIHPEVSSQAVTENPTSEEEPHAEVTEVAKATEGHKKVATSKIDRTE